MSTVKSFATGEGDTYYIKHGSDNFTIIDCRIAEDRDDIIEELRVQSAEKGITRFISTDPDDDHIRGLARLDHELGLRQLLLVRSGRSPRTLSTSTATATYEARRRPSIWARGAPSTG